MRSQTCQCCTISDENAFYSVLNSQTLIDFLQQLFFLVIISADNDNYVYATFERLLIRIIVLEQTLNFSNVAFIAP